VSWAYRLSHSLLEEIQGWEFTMDKQISRRIFLFTGATAAAMWALRRGLGAQPVGVGTGSVPPHDVVIVEFSKQGQELGRKTVQTVVKTDAEWRGLLSRESYEITRQAGTEYPYTGNTGTCMTRVCIAAFAATPLYLALKRRSIRILVGQAFGKRSRRRTSARLATPHWAWNG
jgi:hypothetical protein